VTSLIDAAEQQSLQLDTLSDPAQRRDEFAIPAGPDGGPVAYFAGNSLGLQPRRVVQAVHEVLDSWAQRGVEGHLHGPHPWMPYHQELREPAARLVGALAHEVVVMNSLTVNLHAMFSSFYRPTAERFRIVVEYDAFPSDRYAADSCAALHGLDPADAVIRLRPSAGAPGLSAEDVAECLERHRGSVAVVMLGAVNFRTGALLDIGAITDLVHAHGALAGWDLAHAAGNVPLSLHDHDVDFAVWCSYKYLNSGPGSLAGCFVHQRWGLDPAVPRPSGWWGHDPHSRFAMPDRFQAQPGADGWQVSNPPILSMAAVRASLELFDEVGMDAIRQRSVRLTGHLEALLDPVCDRHGCRIITPRHPAQRGAQLSVEVVDASAVSAQLAARFGVIADERPPNIVRFAPAPLYTSFHDCWRAARALEEVLS
jgi:kynureninase